MRGKGGPRRGAALMHQLRHVVHPRDGEGSILYLKQGEHEVQIGVFRRQPRPDAQTPVE